MINREQGLILRGIAIMSIALHNFLHQEQFGLAQENEMRFDDSNFMVFMNHLTTSSLLQGIEEFFSFIGWCGVPVFVFLSGYGLSKKYPDDIASCKRWNYLLHSFFKLLMLLIPAAVLFMSIHAYQGLWIRVLLDALSVTFITPLISYFRAIPNAAPPFWYFAMTIQLYICFLFVHKKSSKTLLALGGIIFIMLFVVDPGLPQLFRYIRLNSLAWLPLFFIGIVCGRWQVHDLTSHFTTVVLSITSVMSLTMMVIVNVNFYSWLFMTFFSLIFFLSLAVLISRNGMLSSVGKYLGSTSAYIFVAHPIGIFVFQYLTLNHPLLMLTVEYIVLTLIIAECYKRIHHRLIILLPNK